MAQLFKDLDEAEEQQEKQEEQYLLPDGIGLDLDKVRELILKQHDMNIPKDDPILVTVTILNAFLYEQQKLQEEYRTALTTVYQEVLDTFLTQLAKGIKYEETRTENNQATSYENKKLILFLYVLVVVLVIISTFLWIWKF